MNAKIVSEDTGEILAELYDGDRILRNKSLNAARGRTDIQEWRMDNFFKGYIPELEEIMRELTNSEAGFVMKTCFYIGYHDCCLKDKLDNPLSLTALAEISGLTRMQSTRITKSLIKKGVLYKGEDGRENQYFVNPWLFCKGNIVNKVLQTMFRNYKIKVCGGKKWRTIPGMTPQKADSKRRSVH